ncbi:MAG: folate-binding protein [Actinomycetaceae bacterium]|nr:folate-binding protein [Actinomycetaceae bacterium]MDY5273286.1 folate-binding protein [Arcanobacterium sp.]
MTTHETADANPERSYLQPHNPRLNDSQRIASPSANPLVEEAKLRAGRAFVEFSQLETVRVDGEDRLKWLNNLSTAPFITLQPGESREGLILDSEGRILHAFAAVESEDATFLLTDVGRAQPLADFLESMKFMMKVSIAVQPVRVFATLLQQSHLPSAALAGAMYVWEDSWPQVSSGGTHYGRDDAAHPARGVHRSLLVTDTEHASAVAAALIAAGLTPVGVQAWEAARIVDRRPRPNTEVIDGGVLPHELDWLRTAVWLNKGCFPGQETVSKVVNMGKPPRRLVFLYLEGPDGDLPERGAAVSLEGKQVGVLTSVALDYEQGAVALALVKRTVPLEAVLTIEGGQGIGDGSGFVASQDMIVDPNGKSAASPAENPARVLRRARAGLAANQKPQPHHTRG